MISTAERAPIARAMYYASGRSFFLVTLDFSIDIWSFTFSVPAVCRARSAIFAFSTNCRREFAVSLRIRLILCPW